MTRYTSDGGGGIVRIVKIPYSYVTFKPKRIPRPVQEMFKLYGGSGGFIEVDFNRKARSASLVPFYERIQGR